jgi:hypothetical protein
MALIGNQTFALSRFWTSKTIQLVKIHRDLFSKAKLRDARKELIAGANVISGIQGWMLAVQLIQKIKSGEYELTDFARAVDKNDFKLEKSSTWWAIHLAICFSERNEPYASFFTSLENISKDWLKFNDIKNKIDSKIEDAAKGSLDPNLDGVLKMFKDDRPLGDLGLIETQGDNVRLGSPKLTDEIIAHAVARMKFHCFKSRPSVSFSEVTQTGLAHFLCCSNDELRKHLRRMEQSNNWKGCFTFTEAVNVDSVSFGDECDPHSTVLKLLQSGEDTWL